LTGGLGQTLQQSLDVTPWLERALTYFIGHTIPSGLSPDYFLQEVEVVMKVLRWAVEMKRWPDVLALARTIDGPLALSGYWGSWEQVLKLALQAAHTLGDRVAEAWVLHQMGSRGFCLGHNLTAYKLLYKALHLREQLGDWAGAEITRHNLNLLLPPAKPDETNSQPDSPSTESLPWQKAFEQLNQLSPWLKGLFTVALLGSAILLTALILPPPPSPLPTPVAFVTPTDTPLPTPKPFDTPPPTPTFTNTPLPTPMHNPTPMNTSTPIVVTATPLPVTPSPTGACQPPANWVAYVAQLGDTLNSLATRTNTTF
jgi:hypothetical protein